MSNWRYASPFDIKYASQHEDIHHHADKDETDEHLEGEHILSADGGSRPGAATKFNGRGRG
jgi:hypothetical protein